VSGGKMKEAGTSHWTSPNTGATNESGFTALPSGYRRSSDGTFDYLGYNGVWWSSTASSSVIAWFRGVSHYYANCDRAYGGYRQDGFAVRLIKD